MLTLIIVVLQLFSVISLYALKRRYVALSLFVFAIIVQPTLIAISLTENYSVITHSEYVLTVELIGWSVFCYFMGALLDVTIQSIQGVTPRAYFSYYGIKKGAQIFLFVVAISGFALYLHSIENVGIELLRIMSERGIESANDISFYPRWLASWIGILGLLVYADRKARGQSLNVSALLILLIATVWLIIQGGRKALLDFFLLLWLIKGVLEYKTNATNHIQRKSFRQWMMLLIVGGGVFLMVAGLTQLRSEAAVNGSDNGFSLLINGSYGGIDSTAFILTESSSQTKDIVPSVLDWLWFPIPRSWWADKPANLGERVGREMGMDVEFGGPTVNFYAELYRLGGLLSVTIGMLMIGFMAAVLDRRIRGALNDIETVSLLIVFVYGVLNLWILDFSDVLVMVIMDLIPVSLVWLAGRKKDCKKGRYI